jgi:hypothetical protein
MAARVRIGLLGMHGLHEQLVEAASRAKRRLKGVEFVSLPEIPRGMFPLGGAALKTPLREAAESIRRMLRRKELNAVLVIGSSHEGGYLLHALKRRVDVVDSHVDASTPPEQARKSSFVTHADHLSHAVGDGHLHSRKITFYSGSEKPQGIEFLRKHLPEARLRQPHELRNASSPVRDVDADAFSLTEDLKANVGSGNCHFQDLLESIARKPPVAIGLFELPSPPKQRLYGKGRIPEQLEKLVVALARAHLQAAKTKK